MAEAYTSSVLQHFEEALESAIALAFFIPLLIGTGGNSGTQITSTLVRSMALGEVRLRDMGRVIRKEVSTSFLIALTLGLAGCLRAWMMGIGMEITLIVSLTLYVLPCGARLSRRSFRWCLSGSASTRRWFPRRLSLR